MWLLVLAIATLLQAPTKPVNGQELPTSDAGYIDGAIVRNQLRFRFDAAYDNPAPDRAEFFYAQCGCFPGAPGPLKPESSVDYQEIEEYLEYVFLPGISAFVELPIRFIDPVANPNETGLGDVRSGFKYALREGEDRWLTFQLRGYFPTGDGRRGLGTEYYSIEPGLLYQRNYNGMSVFGEFKTWIPIGSSKQTIDGVEFDYSGVVTRYGIGFGYDLLNIHDSSSGQMCDAHQQSFYPPQESPTSYGPGYSPFRGDGASYTQHDSSCLNCNQCQSPTSSDRLTAVVELVGWRIGSGLRLSAPSTLYSAADDTIVNLKFGLRWNTPQDTLYVGFGRALTGDVWYQDLVRAEYAIRF